MSEKASEIHHQTGTGPKMNGRDILFLKWRSESHYAAIGKHGTVMPDLAIFKYPKCQFLYRTPNLRKKCTFKIYLQAASRLRLPNCKSCLTARSPNCLRHSHSCLEEVRMRATLNSVSGDAGAVLSCLKRDIITSGAITGNSGCGMLNNEPPAMPTSTSYDVTLQGKRVFADMIKLNISRC